MTVDLNLLDHLGINLYSNIAAVLPVVQRDTDIDVLARHTDLKSVMKWSSGSSGALPRLGWFQVVQFCPFPCRYSLFAPYRFAWALWR